MPEVVMFDQSDGERYVVEVDGAPAGLLTYRLAPGQISFLHAEVQPSMERQGIGSRLVAFALEDARRRGLAVLPYCPFVKDYIERNGEYIELVPSDSRPRFGL